MSLKITPPQQIYYDKDGTPLDAGFIYIGQVSQNPETNPVAVYWDSALTLPAPQPIRTLNGYPSRQGVIANIYTASSFSITVKSKRKELVFTSSFGNSSGSNYALLVFPNYATASAAAATLPDGQQVNVEDEKKRYRVTSGALQYVRNIGERSVYLDDYLIEPVSSVATAMELAAMAAGKGGRVFVPNGVWTITDEVNCEPVVFEGVGRGGTVLRFDMSSGARNGIVFQAADGIDNVELGAENLSVELIGGNGLSCFTTPTGYEMHARFIPKVTFRGLSFSSERTPEEGDSWASLYGWQWCMRLGDSWDMTLEAIDAIGTFKPEIDSRTQTLDGFVRWQPTNGILSCRISNITTHNVANAFELAGRTYFSAVQVDIARAYRGFYDAADRYYDPVNPYTYGECAFQFVIVNAQKACWDLSYRYFTNFTDCAAHRAGGFDTGETWNGFNLPFSRGCKLKGVHAGAVSTFASPQIGFNFEGGSGADISGVSLGMLSTGFRMSTKIRPVQGTDSGPVRALSVSNVSLLGNVGTMFDIGQVRDLGINGVRTNNQGGYTVATLINNQNPSTNTCTIANVDGMREYAAAGSKILWQNPAAAAGEKTWWWSMTATTLSLLAATDTGSTGNNALIIERDAGENTVKRVELRTGASGYAYINAPELQIKGLVKPVTDNTSDIGAATARVRQYYGVNGAISTSDEREKEQWRDQSDAEKAAALEIKSCIRAFKWTNAVNEKGESARWHWGVGAQTVGDILRKHGIEPATQAYWCYDEWDEQLEIKDEDGSVIQEYRPAGNRYGIRYDELAMFILAAL